MAKPNPFGPKAGKKGAKPFPPKGGKRGAKPVVGDEGFPIPPKGKRPVMPKGAC
jgi:hypothetical protein